MGTIWRVRTGKVEEFDIEVSHSKINTTQFPECTSYKHLTKRRRNRSDGDWRNLTDNKEYG